MSLIFRFIDARDSFKVLHPYYKLAYIKLAWGGPEEKAQELDNGNADAKDWQDEARKIVEQAVSVYCVYHSVI